MKIVFRCHYCESLNEIPEEFRYRLCKKCSTLTTYSVGEAILCEDSSICAEFIQETTLSMKLAEKFFFIADKHKEQIELISMRHDNISVRFLDIPSASRPDTVIHILKQNVTETLDELVRNCKLFDIDSLQLDKIIKRLKNEGLIYHPQGWMIRPI
jgi:hypothetical protein